jgi:hypothetical protein
VRLGIVITPGPLCRLGRSVCITVVARLPHSLNGVFHPKEISAPITTISTNKRIRKSEVRKHRGKKQIRPELFVHHLDLLVEYLAGEPIDGDMHPVVLFTFDDKIVLEIAGIWLVVARLRHDVNEQIPNATL